jgi:hypothetical protein
MCKRAFAILLSILAVNSTFSATPDASTPASETEALRLFAQCDASLFHALKKRPDMLGPSVRVANRGTAASIIVPDPLSQKGNEQLFSAPLQVNGLSLTAWHNEIMYDVNIGGFLYWGFKLEGDPKQVAIKLNALLPDSRKLVQVGELWARSEVRVIGDPIDTWHSGGTSGVVTAKGSVERVLMVEGESPSVTTLYCSLQGSITAPLLQSLRPDLLPSEYPQ